MKVVLALRILLKWDGGFLGNMLSQHSFTFILELLVAPSRVSVEDAQNLG